MPTRGKAAPIRGRGRGDDDRDRDPPRGRSRDDDRGDRGRGRDDDRDSGRGGGRSSASKFVYKPRSFDDVKERAEQTGGKFDSPIKQGFDIWRPKAGDNSIRYCPPSEPGKPYAISVWMHSYIGADNSTYVCPEKMYKKPCPICDAMREAAAQGERDEAKELKPSEKRVAWILDRNEDDPTPQIYIMSWTMNRDVEALSMNKKKGNVVYIDDPDSGYDVRFTRTGVKLNTRYFGVAVERESSPLCDDEKDQQTVIDFIMENPLEDVLQVYDEDHLDKVINGATDSSSADDKNDPPPRGRSRDDDRDTRGRDDEAPRGRGREDPEDEAPRGRRSSREDPPDDDPPPRRGSRDRDPPDDDPPPRRRSSREDPEDGDPEDDRGERGRRGSREDPPDDDPPPRRARGGRDDPPDDDPPAGRRRSSRDDPPDDDPPPRRRGARDDPPDDDPPPRRGGRRGGKDDIPF